MQRPFRLSMRRLFTTFFTAVLWCASMACTGAHAQAQAPGVDDSLDEIRRQLDAAQQSIKKDNIGDAEMQALRNGALAAQAQASDLVAQLTPQLAGVKARVAELGAPAPGAKEDPDIASQRAALARSSSTLDGQSKLARLLMVEGGQLADQLGTLRRSKFQARLGERTNSILAAPFWSELRADLPHDAQLVAVVGAQLGAAARAAPGSTWALAALGLVAAYALLWWLRNRGMRRLTTQAPAGRLRRSLYGLLVVAHRTLVVGVFSVALYAVLGAGRGLPAATEALFANFCGMVWFCGFVYGLFTALVCAKRPSWRLFPLPDAVAHRIRGFAPMLASVILVTWLAERLAALINASLSTTVAVNCLVALVMALAVVLVLMRAERTWRHELAREGARARPMWMALVAAVNWLVLTAAVVSLLAGYVAFGSFAVKQVVWVGIVLGSAYLLAALVDDLLMAWLASGAPEAGGPDQPVAEGTPPHAAGKATSQLAVLASGVLRLTLLLLALILVLAPFGEGPAELLRRSGQWQQSLSIGEFKLQPAAVLQALAVLLGGLGAVRLLRTWLSDRYLPTTSLDAGMRTSATSLFGYAGVVVAVSLALSAMGIGLERIAWVASALSVGIGFGLQAVVQNFVSGLILLAERPVKVGDLVSLGGIEGDIRRINVRATEIQMGDRSTVIVPNSEFITKIVRNATLADPLGLVQLKLPVPLGSDAEQVREMLLASFTANTDVLDSPAPSVLLDGIEHGQLLFNATGFAKSPRVTGNVRSALLFDMLQRLNAAGITLSAPPTMLMNMPSTGAGATPALDVPPALSTSPLTAAPGPSPSPSPSPSTSASTSPAGRGPG